MNKDLQRAKLFQRSLWEAGGREWTDASFTDTWVFSPMAADWDECQSRGLMPIDFVRFAATTISREERQSRRTSLH